MKPTNTINTLVASDDDAPELKPEDFLRVRHRVNQQDVSREAWAAAAREKLGKQRVSIMLDTSVVAFFKAKAGARGYQTLINQALHNAIQQDQLKATLRRVIRIYCKESGNAMITKKQTNIINYLVICISDFAECFAMDEAAAYRFLAKFGGIEFLMQHYEIEHTLSLDDMIEDLEAVCRQKGGILP